MDNFLEIDDGYNVFFNIAPAPGLHDQGLSGYRRPMLVDERDTMFSKGAEKKTRAETNAFYRRVLAGKLVSWDAKDAKGNELAMTAESLRLMAPPLWDKFFATMIGERANDLADGAVKASPAGFDDADAEMEAARRGQPVESGLEAARKN